MPIAISSNAYPKKLRSIQVTLTTANTNYGLSNLLAAIDPTIFVLTRELLLQSDLNNSTAIISVGDALLSSTRYGYQLNSGESRTYVNREQSIDMRDIWLRTDTDGSKVNVEMADF